MRNGFDNALIKIKVEKLMTSCLDGLLLGFVDLIRKIVDDTSTAKIKLVNTISSRMMVGPPRLVVMFAHSSPRVLSVVIPANIARRVKVHTFGNDLLLKIGWSFNIERDIAVPIPEKTLELDKK